MGVGAWFEYMKELLDPTLQVGNWVALCPRDKKCLLGLEHAQQASDAC